MSTSETWVIKSGMAKMLSDQNSDFQSNRLVDVVIHEESDSDIKISGTPILQKASVCWRCNRAITDPSSILRGVGPDCAAALGIDDADTGTLTRIVEVWIPKNQIINPPFTARGTLSRAADHGKKYKASLTIGDARKRASADEPADVKDVLILDCPWISKLFNSERGEIEGYFWSWEDKVACFKYSAGNIDQVYSLCAKWGIELKLTDDLSDALHQLHASKTIRDHDLAAKGLASRQNIKQMSPEEADQYDWSAILNFTPWHHQAQAIAWAAHLLNLTIPTKE